MSGKKSRSILKLKKRKYIDLKKELKEFDVLVSSSNHEGFSRVLLEAIYVGLYCIAFRNSGTEFIDNFQNSKILDSKNLEIINNEIFIVWTISVDGKNQLKSIKFNSKDLV